MPTETVFHVPKEHENIVQYNGLRIFFAILMRIHIATNKCTVNKKTKIKNKQKYTNIDKTKSIKNITLSTILENEGLENENQAD